MANILFIDQYAVLGGAQRILVDLATAFHRAGHGVTVLFPEVGPVSDALEAAGITTGTYQLASLKSGRKGILEKVRFLATALRSSKSIQEVCAGQAFDFMYINGPRAMLPGVLAANRLRLPVVAAVHLIHHGADRWLLNSCFKSRRVKLVSFCSHFAADKFPSVANKGMVLPNWVAPEFLKTPFPMSKEKEHLSIGVLGRVSKNKGQRLFLESVVPLLPDFPNVRLMLAGGADFEDPAEEVDLRKSVAQLGERVSFLGKTEALPFLDTLDISVVPSIQPESFGLVAIESMARGLPVVATRLGGLQETVLDGETGLLVNPETTQLREALRTLIEDSDLRRSMGEAGRKRVESEYNPEVLIPQTMHAILEAVS